MCRFVAYLGAPILAADLITRPENSLIHQSYQARETPEPLNGDGFGMGWYNHALRPEPGLFKAITPAWNNRNLKNLAEIVESNCLFAHIRAATEGGVSEENNHPFRYNQYLMMHNGGVPGFKKIKRDLINRLSDHYFQWINGHTDSEHIFALYMQRVSDRSGARQGSELSLDFLADCFAETFSEIEELMAARGVTEAAVFNMVITDGHRMIATRYSSDPIRQSRTLYFSKGRKYVCEGNLCQMLPADGPPGSMLVVSEKLDDYKEEWTRVPDNHALLIEHDLQYKIRPL